MAEEEFEKRTCHLNVMLSQYGGVHSQYDAIHGLKRRITLFGWINDPESGPLGDINERFPDSAFHHKAARLEISSPADPAWLEEVLTSLGGKNACGSVRVTAGVEPYHWEIEGEVVEGTPVEVYLEVSPDAFESIQRQVLDANEHNRIMRAKIVFSAAALPDTDSHFTFLRDLDVSKPGKYAVMGFEIFNTPYFDHTRGRVMSIDRGRDEGCNPLNLRPKDL